jgi:hypothetical protein
MTEALVVTVVGGIFGLLQIWYTQYLQQRSGKGDNRMRSAVEENYNTREAAAPSALREAVHANREYFDKRLRSIAEMAEKRTHAEKGEAWGWQIMLIMFSGGVALAFEDVGAGLAALFIVGFLGGWALQVNQWAKRKGLGKEITRAALDKPALFDLRDLINENRKINHSIKKELLKVIEKAL